jgi:hypothetical protein
MFAPSEFYNDITYTVTNTADGSAVTVGGVISPSFFGVSVGTWVDDDDDDIVTCPF